MKNPHILLTTDFSEGATGAFAPTVELAAELGGRITLLHVVPELTVIPHGSPLAPPQEPPDLSEETDRARKQLDESLAPLECTEEFAQTLGIAELRLVE